MKGYPFQENLRHLELPINRQYFHLPIRSPQRLNQNFPERLKEKNESLGFEKEILILQHIFLPHSN